MVSRNGKYVLHLAPNFAIQLEPHQIKYLDVNGSKYAIAYIDGDPIHMEPVETQ